MKRSLVIALCLLSSNLASASHGFWSLFDPNTTLKTREGHSIEARLESFTDGSALVWSPFLYLNGTSWILKHTEETGEEICRLFVPGSEYMGATIQANPLSGRIAHSLGANAVVGFDSNGKITKPESGKWQWGFYGVRCQMPLASIYKQLKITSIVSNASGSLLTLKSPWTTVNGKRIFLGAEEETATGLCSLYGYRRASSVKGSTYERSDVYLLMNSNGSVKSISNFRIDSKRFEVTKGKFEISSTPESHISELTCWR